MTERYQPGLPVIPVPVQFMGAAKPRPEGFAAHYLRQDCMTRFTTGKRPLSLTELQVFNLYRVVNC